jgi:hypothetical protein
MVLGSILISIILEFQILVSLHDTKTNIDLKIDFSRIFLHEIFRQIPDQWYSFSLQSYVCYSSNDQVIDKFSHS